MFPGQQSFVFHWNLKNVIMYMYMYMYMYLYNTLVGQCRNQITGIDWIADFWVRASSQKIVIRARMQHMCDDLEGDLLL